MKIRPSLRRKTVDRETCESLLALINMGRARIIKEHGPDGPVYVVFAASGAEIAIIGDKYKYLFEAVLNEHGAGDGLVEGHSQTSAVP